MTKVPVNGRTHIRMLKQQLGYSFDFAAKSATQLRNFGLVPESVPWQPVDR